MDGVDYPGPVNIGNDREISVREVAEYIQRRFPQCAIEHLPPAPQDPVNRRPDLTLAKRLLPGWECNIAYEQGVDRTISWFLDTYGGASELAA